MSEPCAVSLLCLPTSTRSLQSCFRQCSRESASGLLWSLVEPSGSSHGAGIAPVCGCSSSCEVWLCLASSRWCCISRQGGGEVGSAASVMTPKDDTRRRRVASVLRRLTPKLLVAVAWLSAAVGCSDCKQHLDTGGRGRREALLALANRSSSRSSECAGAVGRYPSDRRDLHRADLRSVSSGSRALLREIRVRNPKRRCSGPW